MTILSAKRSKKDFKVYAIVRDSVLPKKYVYGIRCLTDEENYISKYILPLEYNKLTYIRRRFRAII